MSTSPCSSWLLLLFLSSSKGGGWGQERQDDTVKLFVRNNLRVPTKTNDARDSSETPERQKAMKRNLTLKKNKSCVMEGYWEHLTILLKSGSMRSVKGEEERQKDCLYLKRKSLKLPSIHWQEAACVVFGNLPPSLSSSHPPPLSLSLLVCFWWIY